jgi:hypothetical protein
MKQLITKSVAVTALIFINFAYAALPSVNNPKALGDVVARALAIPTAGVFGHIGIMSNDMSLVHEAMNEKIVLQTNPFALFKLKTTYYGARYKNNPFVNLKVMNDFIAKQRSYTPDYSFFAGKTKLGIDNVKECAKRNWLGVCTEYRNYQQAVFRCDTFVNYLYHVTGNGAIQPIDKYPTTLTPNNLFLNYVPYSR